MQGAQETKTATRDYEGALLMVLLSIVGGINNYFHWDSDGIWRDVITTRQHILSDALYLADDAHPSLLRSRSLDTACAYPARPVHFSSSTDHPADPPVQAPPRTSNETSL